MRELKCDIIMPVFHQFEYTKDCIESIVEHTKIPYRIILINNDADKDISAYASKKKQVLDERLYIVDNEDNRGWIRSINQGIEISGAPFVCFMNNDTLVTEGWLEEMISIMDKNSLVGIVNPECEKPENISNDAFAASLIPFRGQYIETDWCRGFCMAVRREVIDAVGGMDLIYEPCYYDDWDYSLKAIEAGFECVKARGSFVFHYRNITAEDALKDGKMKQIMDKNGKIFYARWSKPFKVWFVLSGSLDNMKEDIRKICGMQNKIKCFTTEKNAYKNTTINENVVPIFVSCVISVFSFIFRSAEKIKEQYAGIFTNNRACYSLIRLFRIDRKINVVFSSNPSILSGEALRCIQRKKEEDKKYASM